MMRPIETLYRGYRFRSRLEARWPVFFDAAGIKWSYEDQGYKLNGRGYLPDFWLPQLEIFVETKPDDEACEQALPTLRTLVAATGHSALLIAGAPTIDELPTMTRVWRSASDQGKRPVILGSSAGFVTAFISAVPIRAEVAVEFL